MISERSYEILPNIIVDLCDSLPTSTSQTFLVLPDYGTQTYERSGADFTINGWDGEKSDWNVAEILYINEYDYINNVKNYFNNKYRSLAEYNPSISFTDAPPSSIINYLPTQPTPITVTSAPAPTSASTSAPAPISASLQHQHPLASTSAPAPHQASLQHQHPHVLQKYS